jgi:hypothetical protein
MDRLMNIIGLRAGGALKIDSRRPASATLAEQSP